jgi:copper chaperone CopZ
MWILFLILITSPGQYQVEVLQTYDTKIAQETCKTEAKRVKDALQKAYPSENERDSFELVCVKQKEKEA